MASHLLLDRVYLDKDAQEWIIRKSTLQWVIVRPAVLTNGPKTGTHRVPS
jgi:NAD(P)H-binding